MTSCDLQSELWRDTASTYGGNADCTVTTFDDGSQAGLDYKAQIRCNVDDTDNEGDSLYIDYYNDGFPVHRVEGPVDQDFSPEVWVYGDLRIGEIGWRVCRNDWPFGDPCSDWIRHYPSH